jgi:multicomponent Na+:H+ antiporter subunit F
MLLAAATAGFLAALGMMLARALRGPTNYDRILAANSFGAKTVLLIALLGFLFGRPEFLDIAIAYALINFIATIALLKLFRYRSLQVSLSRRGPSRSAGDLDA